MLSGYECSIFGYEKRVVDSHSAQFRDGEKTIAGLWIF